MYRQDRTSIGTIDPVAGRLITARMINAVQTHWVQLDIQGDFTIATAAAAAIRNRGSLWAAIEEVQVRENGKPRVEIDARVMRVLSEQAAPSALSSVRQTVLTAGTVTLKESARIYFAHPYAVQPRETAFMEHDSKQVLDVGVKLNSDGGASHIAKAGAGGTVSLANLTVRCTHGYDADETIKPFFIPNIRQQIDTVSAASTKLPIYIKSPNVLRSLVLSQDDTVDGEVSDIVNTLKLRGDSRIWVDDVTWEDMVAGSEFEFGGASGWATAAHLGFNFQTFGRLSKCLNPNQDSNLRFELDCQPSATGSGSSQIRTTIVELLTDAQLTQPLTIPV